MSFPKNNAPKNSAWRAAVFLAAAFGLSSCALPDLVAHGVKKMEKAKEEAAAAEQQRQQPQAQPYQSPAPQPSSSSTDAYGRYSPPPREEFRPEPPAPRDSSIKVEPLK